MGDEAPFGHADLRWCVGRDDGKELRGHRVVVGLEFFLPGCEFCVEVIFKGALVDRDGVAPAHVREYSKIDSHGMFATQFSIQVSRHSKWHKFHRGVALPSNSPTDNVGVAEKKWGTGCFLIS